jgi:hypothetical protein
MTDRHRAIVRNVALAAILGLLLAAGDTLLRQASQYRQAEQARKDGKFIPALTAYGSAIRMYVPGSPLTERSARAIWTLADERQGAGDREGAILACRELRSAFYAVRSLTAPGTEWIDRCDRRLAALTGDRNGRPATGTQPDSTGAREKRP